jgi:hypothetical protein
LVTLASLGTPIITVPPARTLEEPFCVLLPHATRDNPNMTAAVVNLKLMAFSPDAFESVIIN